MTAELLNPADPPAEAAERTASADLLPSTSAPVTARREFGLPRLPRFGLAERLGRRGREVAAVAAGSLAVSAVMTWPVLRHPTRTVPQDLVDPLYFVWQVAWTGHALRTDPAQMWTTNAFNHAGMNLAYTDTMLGYAPFAAVFDLFGGMGSALLSFNLLYVLAVALAFGSSYLLARVLGANVPGALVLAAAFAFAPWRLAHARHLNVISTGGIVLTFALLAYGHGWTLRRDRAISKPRPVRPKWIVAGWVVACWQLTLGFAVGVPFAWVLGMVLLVAAVRGWRGPWDRRVLKADLGGGLAFVVTGVLLAIPLLWVVNRFPMAARTEGMIDLYSSRGRSLFVAPAESWWWGGAQASWRSGLNAPIEQTLLPGLVITVLAVAGLFWSAWSLRARIGLALSAGVFAVLALGIAFPGHGRYTYLVLFHYVPGWSALRTPGRLVLWCGLALGLLAAGAVTRWTRIRGRRPAGRRRWALLAVALLPALLVLGEGAGAVAQPVVPKQPVALKALPGPALVLPTSMQGDYLTMTWSTDGWPELINGGSGFESPRQSHMRSQARWFPAPGAVTYLRNIGVRTIVLDRSLATGTAWERLATQPMAYTRMAAYKNGMTVRESGTALVFDLGQRSS